VTPKDTRAGAGAVRARDADLSGPGQFSRHSWILGAGIGTTVAGFWVPFPRTHKYAVWVSVTESGCV
jgi:hypothetical protein